ncbi:hypothetical protein BGW80DRAFT_9259 [Lactifluus volemus]|nr:hypothetical protein BGW80DRAFT_9259 [Lactifluus volemus]
MVRFDPEYPFKSPAVQFVVSDKVKPPVHPVCTPDSPPAPHGLVLSSIRACLYEWPCMHLFSFNISGILLCSSIPPDMCLHPGDDWSPTLSVMAICITIQSMLASCKKKELPEGNDDYVRTAPDNPKKTRFVYHDDTV